MRPPTRRLEPETGDVAAQWDAKMAQLQVRKGSGLEGWLGVRPWPFVHFHHLFLHLFTVSPRTQE